LTALFTWNDFLSKLPYSILKFKYDQIFHDMGKQKIKRIWGNKRRQGLERDTMENGGTMKGSWSTLGEEMMKKRKTT